MTQVANEVTSFKSEVLSNGGSIQRAQNREELKERERLEKRLKKNMRLKYTPGE